MSNDVAIVNSRRGEKFVSCGWLNCIFSYKMQNASLFFICCTANVNGKYAKCVYNTALRECFRQTSFGMEKKHHVKVFDIDQTVDAKQKPQDDGDATNPLSRHEQFRRSRSRRSTRVCFSLKCRTGWNIFDAAASNIEIGVGHVEAESFVFGL